MFKKILQTISFVLIIALLTGMLPMPVFANMLADTPAAEEAVDAVAAVEVSNIISELPNDRDAYTKRFLLDNGNTMAVQYAIPVHYQDSDGNWIQYDNRMTETDAAEAVATDAVESEYRVIQSDKAIRLSKKASEKKLATIEKDGHQISWGFSGINKVDVTFVEEDVSYKGNEAYLTLEGIIQEARYNDAFQNVDLQYFILPIGVKENIILKNANAQNEFEMEYNFHQLTATQTDSRNITLTDKDGNTVYTITAPAMCDANGVWSNSLTLTIVEAKQNKLTVKLTADLQWLQEDERSFPVTVDPSFTTEKTWGSVDSTTIVSGHPNTAYGPNSGNYIGSLYVGYEPNSSFRKTRSLVRLNTLPQLSPGDVIVDAQLCLLQQASYKNIQVNVHQVTADWAMKTATWNTMNANYNSSVEDYDITTYSSDRIYNNWNVTDLVRQWYDGTAENHGLMLIAPTETATSMSRVIYYASTYPNNVTVRPVFQITYRNHNGLESYWDYTASSAGRAGTGYVNSYTGNLVWTKADMGFGGNRGVVSIQHIYNTNDAQENLFGMGYGWRTNYNQRVYQWTTDSSYYVWEDEDGTDHYFKKQSDGTYKDEDNLDLTLTVSDSSTEKYIIENKYGSKTYFDANGRLTKISNNQQIVSNVTVSYVSSDSLLISTVTDGVGRVYAFSYDQDGVLYRLSYRSTGTTELFYISYGYTYNLLTSVTDKDGKTVTYTYDADYHYLTSASDIDGYKITYEYTHFAEGKPSRITKVQEFDGTAAGGVLTIAYGRNETTFTDKLGNVQVLQFNNWGNTRSIQDGEGRAQFAQYAQDTNSSAKGNQLTLSSKLQNTVVNLLTDSSFESSTLWTPDLSTPTMSYSIATGGYLGSKAMKISGCSAEFLCSPTFTVGAGESYTFSGYVKTTAGSAKLGIRNSNVQEDAVYSDAVSTGGEWVRVQVSYTNNTQSAKTMYACFMGLDSATAYIDCVQLEQAPTASRYNLIQNGDFQSDGQWVATNAATGDGRATVTAPAPKLDSTAYAITGKASQQKNICQTVSVSGVTGDSFVLGGWAMGDAVPAGTDRAYGLYAIFHYTDGTESEAMMAAFNPDADSWQYAAVAIVAEKDYSSIDIYACYDRGANTVHFDGIQLFKEIFGASYTYDPETGDVISVVDLQNKETTYEYTNNDLTKATLPDGTVLTYDYDDYHNVTEATSAEGQVYKFEYDGYGNNTKVSIVSGNSSISSSAAYSTDGNRLESVTDALGNVTTYSYNADTGVLEWVKSPKDSEATRTNYTYDEMYRVASAAATTDTGKNMSANYTYTDDYLTKIQTPTTTYNFTYGDFGLRTSVKVGTQNLATYTYDDQNRLERLDYGNNDRVEYTYDEQSRLVKETYEDGSTVSYAYDNTGALATVTDSATGITTTYYYDLINRLVKYEEKGTNRSHSVTYTYDEKNNLSSYTEILDGVSTTYAYTYDDDNRVTSMTVGNTTVTYTYDDFGRMSQQVTKHGDTVVLTENATFKDPDATTTSSQITSYNGFDYTYDANGNILSVSDGTNTTTYEYDSLNQLIRENNQALNKTYVWTYDNAGNIQNRTEYAYTTAADLSTVTPTKTVTYSYGNSNWGDLLTGYDGKTFTYDEIGNLTSDGTRTYTWNHGRQLASISGWTMTYDANGMRTKRADTSNVYVYDYVYSGSQLTKMTVIKKEYLFTYDANGVPLTVTYEGTTYYYSTNLQGDVVAVLDSTGATVITYTYDAWGNCTEHYTDYLLYTFIHHQPLRYRGYVYDVETGLYYLQSRYYNPQIGRFINGDSMIGVNKDMATYNLYVYCGNNPVSRYDSCGMFWEDLVSGIIHAVHNFAIAIGIDTAEIGAFFLMMEKDDSGVYHAVFDCWQQYAGYNELYDEVFDLGTSMAAAKFEFSYDGKGYTIWAWKGDYINMGAGAELGIYRGSSGHRVVDKSLAMQMGMIVFCSGKKIIHHFPNEHQWWITGFNPQYQNIDASALNVTFGIKFNSAGMYAAFKQQWGGDSRWSFYDHLNYAVLQF